jgi:hypothetical protein
MSQADPPGQGERRPADSGSLQPWEAAGNERWPEHPFRTGRTAPAQPLEAARHLNQNDGESWGPAPAKKLLDFGSNVQPTRGFLLGMDGRPRPPGSLIPVTDKGVC